MDGKIALQLKATLLVTPFKHPSDMSGPTAPSDNVLRIHATRTGKVPGQNCDASQPQWACFGLALAPEIFYRVPQLGTWAGASQNNHGDETGHDDLGGREACLTVCASLQTHACQAR